MPSWQKEDARPERSAVGEWRCNQRPRQVVGWSRTKNGKTRAFLGERMIRDLGVTLADAKTFWRSTSAARSRIEQLAGGQRTPSLQNRATRLAVGRLYATMRPDVWLQDALWETGR
jgi:probable HAF family extracellular repeat protein